MSISDERLREIAREIPEVKRLLQERKQIELDGKTIGGHTKPAPHLTPSNDKYHPKKYSNNNSEVLDKITKDKLRDNAQRIEKAVYANFDKKKEQEQIKGYKQFTTDELVIFIEKGREAVTKQREEKKKQTKIDFDQNKKPVTQKGYDRLYEAYERLKEEWKENDRDIEHDKEYSR